MAQQVGQRRNQALIALPFSSSDRNYTLDSAPKKVPFVCTVQRFPRLFLSNAYRVDVWTLGFVLPAVFLGTCHPSLGFSGGVAGMKHWCCA